MDSIMQVDSTSQISDPITDIAKAIYESVSTTSDVIKLLDEDRTAVDKFRDELGQSALMKAALSGRVNTVRVLMEANANVNLKDNNGNTALMLAIKGKQHEVVSILLESKIDVNMQNNWGYSALTFAVEELSLTIQLIDAGANVNIQDAYGFTPLMIACHNDNLSVVEKLIACGADLNIKNENDKGVFDFSYSPEIQDMLLKNMTV